MKKVIGILLALVLLISLAPVQQVDAATKLNKTKLTIKVDETYSLSLSGVNKGVTWSSSDKAIVKVSSTGKIKGLDVGEATITVAYKGKKYSCKVTVEYDIDTMLNDTYGWVVDIWNDSFCNVTWYTSYGTNSIGEEMDIKEVIAAADKHMEKIEFYDKFIKTLSEDDYYDDLNELWPKIVKEINYLYERLKKEVPEAGNEAYEFKTEKFNDYMYELSDVIY
jgi:uncharacterized lipoprotein YehR (DUF1307 family)